MDCYYSWKERRKEDTKTSDENILQLRRKNNHLLMIGVQLILHIITKVFQSFKSFEVFKLLTCRETRYEWFSSEGVEFIWPEEWHLSHFELEAVKRCLTLVTLLNTGMQLPGDVWTKLSPRCFIPLGSMDGFIQQILEVWKQNLST